MADTNDVQDVRGLLTFRQGGAIEFKDTSQVQAPNNKRSYTLTSYNWAEEYDANQVVDSGYKVPKAILTEFQPVCVWDWDNVKSKVLATALSKVTNITGLKTIIKGVVQKYIYVPEQIIEAYAANPGQVLGKPMDFVKRLFSGQYLNSYELPFLTDTYLKADTTDSWSIGGSEKALGEEAARLVQEDYSISFPMTPVWSKNGEANIDFEYDFYLINNSNDNLLRNFRFINAFASGNFWVQLGLMQQSPNVFDIVVPGRFHKYFCALGVQVDYVGKTRSNDSAVSTLTNEGINLGADMLFPDAYKVTVRSRDLTPNNFNTYMDFLTGSYNKVVIGQQVEQMTGADISIKDFTSS